MRTLKKTLSLVLVVAMVLGLCVVGASAYNKVEDFTDDVSKIGTAYYEAVGVLTGIGVIDGMTETAFEPQGNYTREQAAKIIAYMQLGKDKADSLKCTVAPFEDVAATRWSAGYIAYCVEQGIIDGMTETTFEPTGKLTGFQWAKMLLCAVGFGVNGEFTGSSWSVNTAKVAHTVDLFKGDLAGADHTAITREQAALYAFNVLTNVKKVAYSPNVTSYVYGIQGYTTVNGIGSTLGQDVFGLKKVEGIVIDNEGLGSSATVLSKNYSTSGKFATFAAGTGIDMLYHAARVWYVGNNSVVYTHDMAKTTTANCLKISATAAELGKNKSVNSFNVGNAVSGSVAYEYSFIDNTAYAANSYADVTFYYAMSALGQRNTAAATTVVAGTTVKNSLIKTDISAIHNGNVIIYMKAGSAYYVYAPTATTGTVKTINNVDKTITLTDGTVLEGSALWNKAWTNLVLGTTYAFVLDTHGHFVSWSTESLQSVAYYTGTCRYSTAQDAWFSDYAYTAQFVNVTTGEITEVPVSTTWANTYKITGKGQYFDIGQQNLVTSNYNPSPVTYADSVYGGKYIIRNNDTTFNAGNYKVTYYDKNSKNWNNSVYFDSANVTFVIASNRGNSLVVDKYEGLAALLSAYNTKYNTNLSSVTFKNVVMTVANNGTNYAANTVFAYDGNYSMDGGVLFFPVNVSSNDWILDASVNGYKYIGVGYLNGSSQASEITVASKNAYTRGFYTYTVDAYGRFTLSPYTAYSYVARDYKMTNIGERYWLNDGSTEREIDTANVKIIDLRDVSKPMAIEDLKSLLNYDNVSETLAYTWNAAGKIDVIYVINSGLVNTVKVNLSNALVNAGWSLEQSTWTDLKTDGTASVTAILVNKNVNLGIHSDASYPVTVNGTSGAAVYEAGNKLKVTISNISFSGSNDVVYTIDGLKLTGTVSVDSGLTKAKLTSASTFDIVLGQSINVTVKDTSTPELKYEMTMVINGANYETYTAAANPVANAATVSIYPLIWGDYTVTAFAPSYSM